MKTKHRNMTLASLLSRLAIRLVAKSPETDLIQKHADKQWNRIRAELHPDELRPVEMTAEVFRKLGDKLLACQDVLQVELSVSYVEALVQGEVMITTGNQLVHPVEDDPFGPVDRMKWISISKGIPQHGETFLYLTANKKVGVCANRVLDEWFIQKYSVTHWAYPPDIVDN